MAAPKKSSKKTAKPGRAVATATSKGAFGPPLWGNRLAVPLVPIATGDAAVDAAMAAFVAKSSFVTLKKVMKVAKPGHVGTLFAGTMLDLGEAYQPTAAELATLDKATKRAWHRALLDFGDADPPRRHLFYWMLNHVAATPVGRAKLLATATDRSVPASGRHGIASVLKQHPEATLDDLVALAGALDPCSWAGPPDRLDDTYVIGVELALLIDPEASAKRFAALLALPHTRGPTRAVLDGIAWAFSDNVNFAEPRATLGEQRDRKAMARLVAPVAKLVDDPEFGDRASYALSQLEGRATEQRC